MISVINSLRSIKGYQSVLSQNKRDTYFGVGKTSSLKFDTFEYSNNKNNVSPTFKALTPNEKQMLLVESGLKKYLESLQPKSHLKPEKVDEILTNFVGESRVDRTKEFFVSPRSVSKGVTRGRVIFYTLPETEKVVVLETHRVPKGSVTRLFDYMELNNGEYNQVLRGNRSYLYKRGSKYGFNEGNYYSKLTHINSGTGGKNWVDTFSDDLTKVSKVRA